VIRIAAILILLASSGLVSASESGARFDTLLGFTLNQTNLDLVEAKLGKARQYEVPGGDHEFAICYRLGGNTRHIVTFESGNEFGGPDRELLGFSIQSVNPLRLPCSKSAILLPEIAVANLSLGMTQSDFKAALGEPFQTDSEKVISRVYSSQRTLSPSEKARFPEIGDDEIISTAYTTLGVVGRFKNNVLVRFSVHRSVTF